MEDIEFHNSTTKKAKSNRKITFNEKPEYFTIMPTNSEDVYNDNDLRNDSSSLIMNMDHTKESKMDNNSNYIQSSEEQSSTLNQTLSEDIDDKRNTDDEFEEEDDDAALEIISDKVVLLMMNTGGVADKYTPAVRNMQEGKKLLNMIFQRKKFQLISCKTWITNSMNIFHYSNQSTLERVR